MLQVSMALSVTSPCGYVFEEEEEVAVFESTAAEFGGLTRPRLPELSLISPGLDPRPSTTEQVGEKKPKCYEDELDFYGNLNQYLYQYCLT